MQVYIETVRDWFDRNFTIRGLAALIVLIFCAVPDWKSRGEYWEQLLHWETVKAFVLSGWGRLMLIAFGGLIIWLDHRSVLKKHRIGLLENGRPLVETKSHIPELLAPAAPLPATTAMLKSGKREIVNVTPEYLTGFFKQGHTSVQAGKLAEAFIGKWLQVSGPLGDVQSSGDFSRQVTFKDRSIFTHNLLLMYFRTKEWADRLSTLKPGDTITVIGKITDITSLDIHLDHCEIVDS